MNERVAKQLLRALLMKEFGYGMMDEEFDVLESMERSIRRRVDQLWEHAAVAGAPTTDEIRAIYRTLVERYRVAPVGHLARELVGRVYFVSRLDGDQSPVPCQVIRQSIPSTHEEVVGTNLRPDEAEVVAAALNYLHLHPNVLDNDATERE